MGKLTHTVSGNIASFRSAGMANIETLKVNLPVQQTGTGDPSPTNIRPLVPWTGINVYQRGYNIFDTDNAGWVSGKYINDSGEVKSNSSYMYTSEYTPVLPSATYTFSLISTSSSTGITVCKYDASKNFISREIAVSSGTATLQSGTITTDSDTYFVRFSCNKNANYIMIEVGSNVHSNYSSDLYKPYAGVNVPVTWTVTGGLYAGYVDVAKGNLVMTHKAKNLGDCDWTFTAASGSYKNRFYTTDVADEILVPAATSNKADITCTQYAAHSFLGVRNGTYDKSLSVSSIGNITVRDTTYTESNPVATTTEFKAAMDGVYAVYALETPVTTQITAVQINALLDYNNIWADNGSTTEVEYEFTDILSYFRMRMVIEQESSNTIGGLPIYADNCRYASSNGTVSNVVSDNDYFLTGIVDTGSTAHKYFTVSRFGAPTAAAMRVFNDLTATSVDYWSIMRTDIAQTGQANEYTFAKGVRYLILSVYKPIADKFFLKYQDGEYLLKGNNVT